MCGIAGIIDLTGMDRMIEGYRLKAMAESLFHRGPDQAGYFKEPGIGLVSQRLIINDPSGGKQPIVDSIGKSRIVYNGEITIIMNSQLKYKREVTLLAVDAIQTYYLFCGANMVN